MDTNDQGRTRQRHGIAIGEGQIRRIFPVFVVAMWVVTGFWIANGVWTNLNWLLAAAAAICCAVVFVNFVHVFNYGYAASLFVLNLVIIVAKGAPLGAVLLGGLLMVYGVRLWLFTFLRYRSPGFVGRKAGLKIAHKNLPGFVKVALFLQTTTLMTFHAMSTYNVATKAKHDHNDNLSAWVLAGAAILLVGLLLEAVADGQKQRAKAASPSAWIETGLFKRVRYPNYLGEIVVQVGVVVAGLGSGVAWYGYAAAVLAPLYIMILMLSATTGGELSKEARYGEDPDYQAYVARSGALLPF